MSRVFKHPRIYSILSFQCINIQSHFSTPQPPNLSPSFTFIHLTPSLLGNHRSMSQFSDFQCLPFPSASHGKSKHSLEDTEHNIANKYDCKERNRNLALISFTDVTTVNTATLRVRICRNPTGMASSWVRKDANSCWVGEIAGDLGSGN